MARLVLRFIHEFRDRHGKVRRYFRRPGFKRIPLHGEPGSEQFMDAYQAALAGFAAPKIELGATKTRPGTINALVARYYRSTGFVTLAPSTQATYRNIIERFREDHGDKRVALLGRDHIKRMLETKASTPAAANNWLRMVRMLMAFALDEGMRADNPASSVRGIRYNSDGYPSWTDDHIEAFRARHPLGSRPRLAMELLYNTAQRRSDAVKMGPQHVRAGVLSIRQQKTGMLVEIPVLPDLQAAISSCAGDHLAFLVTDYGKPFSAAGFGNWFRDQCSLAGLPLGYSAHGLRKAAATRLADAGCTDHQIMAFGGWQTIKEVQRYTRAANRKRLAQSAADKLEAGTSSGKP